MPLLSRTANLLRGERLSREVDEELENHIQDAIENGRDPAEARRAFGSMLRQREKSRDVRLIPWLESLRADIVFGWRQLVKNRVEMIAVSYASRVDLTYGSDQEMEQAYRQYVLGCMFSSFGIRPALGRLLTAADDVTPRAHPYAVLSNEYWNRRFGGDPKVLGRSLRVGNDQLQIIGVSEAGFTGTEPGTMVDVFVPTMMHAGVMRSDWSWFRPLAHLKEGVAVEPLRDKLAAVFQAFQEERVRGWKTESKLLINRFLNQTLMLEPAPSGISGMQSNYRRALTILGVLVALVLLIACANNGKPSVGAGSGART